MKNWGSPQPPSALGFYTLMALSAWLVYGETLSPAAVVRHCSCHAGRGLYQLGRRGALGTIGAVTHLVKDRECGRHRLRPKRFEHHAVLTFPRSIGDRRRGLAARVYALGDQILADVDETTGPAREIEPAIQSKLV